MSAAVATPVPSAELEAERCGSEEENRGVEAEDRGQQQTGPSVVPHNRLSKLPLARIKALMKTDPDVSLASQESVFIIAKATELFVEMIAKDAMVYAQQGKRKTLQRKDLDNAIEAIDEFAFLEGEAIFYIAPKIEIMRHFTTTTVKKLKNEHWIKDFYKTTLKRSSTVQNVFHY